MKKLKLLLLLSTSLFSLSACGENESQYQYGAFTTICTHGITNASKLTFFKSNDTDLMYTLVEFRSGYGGGASFNPYYNQDGNIMTYNEFKEVHRH